MKAIILSLLFVFTLIPAKVYADVHNRPTTTATLSPSPTNPAQGLTIYSNPTSITLQPTADSGYTIANTYYKIDGGSQQTYSTPFNVTGSGTHYVEYWSVDNSGLEEFPHNQKSFTITPQQGTINSIIQDPNDGTTLNIHANFDNFAAYAAQLYNDDCYNDSNSSFEIYNANTGTLVVSRSNHNNYSNLQCHSLGSPDQVITFFNLTLPSGTYFVHMHGGDNEEWLTNNFAFTAPVAHNKPVSTSTLSPTPNQVANGLTTYTDPVTMTIQATADSGYTVANTYYKIDGGFQQTYSTPFTVTGSGTHTVEYWSVDNVGLRETSHKYQTFIVNPQHGVINSIVQPTSQTEIDVTVNLDNFAAYAAKLYNDDCYNDLHSARIELYNADTHNVVISAVNETNFHCYSLGTPYQKLVYYNLNNLPAGHYFIHYHGSDNEEWITDTFNYDPFNPAHLRPTTAASLSPNPSHPGDGLSIYTNPVTVSLTATADSGYTVANTYYKIDGGSQQIYSTPFTVSGSGTHYVEYWTVDSSGLEEQPHKSQTFIISPQHGVINYILQGGVTINAHVNFDNFSTFTAQLYNDDCYNDPHPAFEIYNATTGAKVSSESEYSHCHSLGTPDQTLDFPPLQLPYGTYFIHYHGTDNEDWITDNFVYSANNAPVISTISDKTINTGDVYTASGSFTDSDSGSWTATVDYGDGSGAQPLTLSNKTFSLSHAYPTPSTYTVTIKVTDNQGATGTATATVTVNNRPPHVNPLSGGTINEGGTYSENGSFTDSDSTSWTVTVDYGDGAGQQPLTLNADKTFSLSHSYKDNGNYTVSVVVTDNQQNTGTTMTSVTVNNIVPAVGTITASINPILINTPTTASASFTDPGILDTHTASWNWGDGTTSPGAVTESNGSGNVSNNHSYTVPGVYTVTLTVTDKDNGQGTTVYQYLSAYATTTKSVSGSKEYVSPAGAFISNPTVTGTASFGFTAQYDNAGNVISQGNKWASVTFKSGTTNYVDFNATAYTALVVSGAKVTLQGTGTYNGNAGYTVLITAIDGSQTGGQDLVRYQIKSPSGSVVYDTQPGATLTADPTTPVSKGNISVK